jgi:hypothetical protein
MKSFTFILFILLSLSANSQKSLAIDWTFHTGSIYREAFEKYLISTNQKYVNKVNYDSELPIIGIYLVKFKSDSLTQKEVLDVRFCLDETWQLDNFDYFLFYGSKLLLINRHSGNYISHHDLEELIQDRVYSRKPKEERMMLSEGTTTRNKITFEVDKYDGWYSNGNKQTLMRNSPYFVREIEIDPIQNSIRVK